MSDRSGGRSDRAAPEAASAAAPRTLLMTTDPFGAGWTCALDLAAALAPSGVNVALAIMGAPVDEEQRSELRAVHNVELHESRFRLEWMNDPWRDVARAGEWLLALADALHPDLVHLHHYAHGALAWPCPSLLVGHSCALSWSRAVRRHASSPALDRYRREVGRGVRAASALVAPTQATLDALGRDFGPLPPTSVIHDGRAPRRFAAAPVKEPFVLSIGALSDEAANLVLLDGAAPHSAWPVRVASRRAEAGGDRGASAPHSIELLGALGGDEIAPLLGRASIYVQPARYEPWGISIIEAALSGCALVLGDLPNLRELWGESASYVAPDDPHALARAIGGLIADPVRRRRKAEDAQARARALSPARMAHAYLALYARLMAARPGVRSSAS